MRTALLAPCLFAAFFVGCLEELPDPAKVEGLRVLAIRADPPEAAEGQPVTVEALVAHPDPTVPLTLRWLACLKPERSSGFFSGGGNVGFSGGRGFGLDDPGSCFSIEQAGYDVTYLGDTMAVRLEVPTGVLSGESIANAYGLPASLPEPAIAILRSVSGVNLSVSLEVRSGGAKPDLVEAFKRVNVSTATPKNTNPADVLFHLARPGCPADDDETAPTEGTASPRGTCFGEAPDAPVALVPGTTYRVRPMNIPEDMQVYPVLLGSTNPSSPFGIQEKEEVYFYSMFSSHGSFGDRVFKSRATPSTTWELPSDMPERVPLWIVVRDGRGGTAWCHSTIARALPPGPDPCVGAPGETPATE